jgi:hypothetical protein
VRVAANLVRVAAKIARLPTSSYKYVLIDKMVYINVVIRSTRRGHVPRDARAVLALRQSGSHEYDAQTQFDRVDRLNAADGPAELDRLVSAQEGYPI